MTAFVGGESVEAQKLKAPGWGSNATNEFGFSALPGGYGNSDGTFGFLGAIGLWWSANDYQSGTYAIARYIGYSGITEWDYRDKAVLASVRCLRE